MAKAASFAKHTSKHPDYVPLLQRAYEQWRALQEECHASLLIMTGGLMIGPRDGVLVQGALASARAHNLPHELISADEIQHRFPPFRVSPEMVAVQEPNAGVLHPEACIRAHLDGATTAGAMLRLRNRSCSGRPGSTRRRADDERAVLCRPPRHHSGRLGTPGARCAGICRSKSSGT